ncbi:MAG: cyclic nucleotide-binding domain-containing protein [Pseudomonadales bacterium]
MVALKPKEFFEQNLQESTFVKALPPSDAELIGGAGEYVDYEADATLFLEGDDADAMYFIVSGTIVIFTSKGRDSEQELTRLGPLDHFGEQGLLSINAGKRTASARTAEKTRLIRVSGELIKNTLAHQSKLVDQLEKIGAEQQKINRDSRKVQLLLRLSRSRASVNLKLPRYSENFSSLLLGVDVQREVLQLDEIMSEYRNPIRPKDLIAVSGSIMGTPISFKTRVIGEKVIDGSKLYECAFPEDMVYEQQRSQFRLELGAASRAEACIIKDEKKYRGKISDVSERGAAFKLRRGVPIQKGDRIDFVELILTPEITIQPKIEVMNVLDVAKAPNLQQYGVRFLGISTADSAALKEFMREEERKRLRMSRR